MPRPRGALPAERFTLASPAGRGTAELVAYEVRRPRRSNDFETRSEVVTLGTRRRRTSLSERAAFGAMVGGSR